MHLGSRGFYEEMRDPIEAAAMVTHVRPIAYVVACSETYVTPGGVGVMVGVGEESGEEKSF